ncbi:ArsR family transcriptional regulator [Idiomarina tyrosinivorans]|uniref:ArsR family transcriptional regulator n=1 Tax=Idiomarina tyrosinivorans TaxID=1445662 RepID=A0A432ZT99_9GAMM|nr:metalloregulator ArsR/SmtB family transcription factor [Idiomarina tyrosinivorans]RUO81061.1 ArsR family transcriptional regulator [Idiomarina tyrosinivorans]
MSESDIPAHNLTVLAETFRLLGEPNRLRILFCCLQRPKSVGEIVDELELSQTLVSHHLRLLRGARLVKGQRKAKQVFYDIDDRHVSDMLIDMATHIDEEHHDH